MRRRHCLLPFAQQRRAACARIPKKRKGSPVVELPFGWSPQHPHAARRGKSDVQRRQKIGTPGFWAGLPSAGNATGRNPQRNYFFLDFPHQNKPPAIPPSRRLSLPASLGSPAQPPRAIENRFLLRRFMEITKPLRLGMATGSCMLAQEMGCE